ncbi:hypothetical protein BDV28DRAFT_156106 [Aspergillus coremiiformis]|uniref:Kelch repeat protein n=1 Tax=Aspergillus coremiiformis TaxID=138285 RepID=A0A5N6ZCY4_9EURO|nr:hypothetical protein BDV28DRAFT_156106 [Aspergillus coremiiformis]
MTTRQVLGVFLALAAVTLQQPADLLKDFCRIFGHQTAVIDRTLYIDGGFVNYNPLSQHPLNDTNTALLYADVDIINYDGMPTVYDNLTKPADAPDVNGGILWSDSVNKMLYLYGGEFSQGSPANLSIWTYDALYHQWSPMKPDATQKNIQRASYGAGVALQDRAAGFYYGGWLSNASVPAWGSLPPMALSGLLEYDMLQNSWTNSTGPDTVGRAEGVMVYIPSSEGMLVYFGGVKTPYSNGTVVGQPMDEILLYDISGSKWYTQKATGQVPEQRRRFCAGVTWAQDYSSYNIYFYGGLSIAEGPGFDDVYILTLPSFRWIKWYPVAPGPGYPHHSMSCTVIDGAQMIVMGGTYPNSTDCDVPKVIGMHNMYLGKQNPQNAIWARFRPNITTYQVPTEIISVIGGSPTGGATTKTPANGFDDRDLEIFFQRVYTAPTRQPTRAIPTSTEPPSTSAKSTPVGAIVGGVVGGVCGVSAAAVILYCCWRRKKSAPTEAEEEMKESELPELDAFAAGPEQPSRRSELHGSLLVELEGDTAMKMSPSSHPILSDDAISPATSQRRSATSTFS